MAGIVPQPSTKMFLLANHEKEKRIVAEFKNFAPPAGLGPAGAFLLQKSGA